MLIAVWHVKINVLHDLYLYNRYLAISFGVAVPFLFNYILLVHNGRHERFFERYRQDNEINLGRNYFIFSLLPVVLFLLLTVLFPGWFGLKR